MYELRSREEFIRALIGNEVVFIEFYEPGNKESEIFSEAVKRLEKTIDPSILVCRINIKEHPEIVEYNGVPSLRVYYNRNAVFEQIGGLSTIELNLSVLRRGIREVFKMYNIKLRV
ncbi:MAG: hypothetical protein QXP02_01690 [Desulfurococcaceae archaeon]